MEQHLQISQDKFCTMQSRMRDGEEEEEEEEEVEEEEEGHSQIIDYFMTMCQVE
jgi:hypothetical protein